MPIPLCYCYGPNVPLFFELIEQTKPELSLWSELHFNRKVWWVFFCCCLPCPFVISRFFSPMPLSFLISAREISGEVTCMRLSCSHISDHPLKRLQPEHGLSPVCGGQKSVCLGMSVSSAWGLQVVSGLRIPCHKSVQLVCYVMNLPPPKIFLILHTLIFWCVKFYLM